MSLDWLFVTLAAMLESPITLVTIALAFSLGLWRGWWWMPAAVALVAGCASTALLYKHWQRVGISVPWQFWQATYLFAIYTYPAFAIARLLIRVKNGISEDPGSMK